MDIRTLDIFVRVAVLGSFAAVAREQDLDPSSVSRTISTLEEEVGVRLFQRTTRHLSLTEAGENYLNRVKPLVQELQEVHDQLASGSGQLTGPLRITSSVAFGERVLVPHMVRFREQFPAIVPELVLSDDNLDLVSNRIDLAIRLGDAVRGEVIASRWMNTRYYVCATPDYLATHQPLQKPTDLSGHSCIVFTLPDYRSSWSFRNTDDEVQDVAIDAGIAISNALALRRATLAGIGPALLADWLIQEDLAAGRLVNIFPDFEVTATSFNTGVWFVYPSRAYLPSKVRAMIDFLRSATKRPLGSEQ